MKVRRVKHPTKSIIQDFDYLNNISLFIDTDNNVFFNYILVNIEIDFEWPLVRILDSRRFIIVEGGSRTHYSNYTAWIFNSSGKIKQELNIGYPIDICITKGRIITTYSECSLGTDRIFATEKWKNDKANNYQQPLSSEGLCVFDLNGNCIYRYMSDAKSEDFIFICQINSIYVDSKNEVYLLAMLMSDGFTILKLNQLDFKLTIELNIENLIRPEYYPRAITKRNENWYTISTNEYELEEIRNSKMNIEEARSYISQIDDNSQVKELGDCCFSFRPRGISNGVYIVPYRQGNKNESQYIQI